MGELVSYYYRKTRMGAFSKTYIIKDGEVVPPRYERRSRSGRHGEDYYLLKDVEEADVILHVDITNSGKHHCIVEIKKDNEESVRKALEIHDCEEIVQQLPVKYMSMLRGWSG